MQDNVIEFVVSMVGLGAVAVVIFFVGLLGKRRRQAEETLVHRGVFDKLYYGPLPGALARERVGVSTREIHTAIFFKDGDSFLIPIPGKIKVPFPQGTMIRVVERAGHYKIFSGE